jgi:hypothetical protein
MNTIPRLARKNGCVQLYVDGAPMLLLGVELHNSSSSSEHYLDSVWEQVVNLSINTILAPVTWELLEPSEGRYDFSQVDRLLSRARKSHIRLILLWFGTWKNSHSTYVPAWVKTDASRFVRAKLENGKSSRSISCFSDNTCAADASAFRMLMNHLSEMDSEDHTVLAVQVENEAGLLGSPRDYGDQANQLFASDVPAALLNELAANHDQLHPQLRSVLSFHDGLIRDGSWRDVFGEQAEEAFMAYHTAGYINRVANAGKEAYPLPMLVNAWPIQYAGEPPGHYPSGGPIAEMLDIWKFAAPAVDIFAPDLYLLNFADECSNYTRLSGNPLFIPETRRDKWAPSFAFYAFGQHDAICFSPFAVDSIGKQMIIQHDAVIQDVFAQMGNTDISEMLQKTYETLACIAPDILRFNGTGRMAGILQDAEPIQTIRLGKYLVKIVFNETLDQAKYPSGGLIIALTDTEYLVAGFGFQMFFIPGPDDRSNADYLSIEEMLVINGQKTKGRRLNGDEQRMIFQAWPEILQVSLYSFE